MTLYDYVGRKVKVRRGTKVKRCGSRGAVVESAKKTEVVVVNHVFTHSGELAWRGGDGIWRYADIDAVALVDE